MTCRMSVYHPSPTTFSSTGLGSFPLAAHDRSLGRLRTTGMVCASQMQGDVHHVALVRGGAGKAHLIEHAQRPPIAWQGMRVQVGDTGIAGDKCQMMQHR
jgi:hypothetical protein